MQADVEDKREKVRRCSASSSMDEASCSSSSVGLKGADSGACPCSCPSTCCCAQHGNHCCPSSSWPQEASTSSGNKRKGKLWEKASSSKGETKSGETQGDVDAQLLEQLSTNSSEFDSPSLSGSLPSVADSHCSHFSSELSCSDPETSRPAHAPCLFIMDPHPPTTTFSEATVTPMPEVENDRLEHLPSQRSNSAFTQRLLSSSPPASPEEGSSGTFLYISEESVVAETETTNNAAQPESPTKKCCVQTDM